MIRTKPSNDQYRKGWDRIFQQGGKADASDKSGKPERPQRRRKGDRN